MDFQSVVDRRHMVRSFTEDPVPEEMLARILANAQRAPSAGYCQGWAFVVLVGPEETAPFWNAVSDAEWRAAPDWPGLLRAPVIVVPLTDEAAYRARYAEVDKASRPASSSPWWLVDTAFATMVMLLSSVDAGLGALFFGLRQRDDEVRQALGIPARYQPLGAVALGWPDGKDRPSASLARGRRPPEEVVHRGRW
jgi:nitroreductase